MLWNLLQQIQIHGADAAAREARCQADAAGINAAELQRRVEALSLACAAVWELVREHTAVTEDDLLDKIHELDLRDGAADGKMSLVAKTCSRCKRVNHPSREQCIYCGTPLGPSTPFH